MRINKEIFYEDIENGREILIFNKFNPFRFRILTNFEIYYPNRYNNKVKCIKFDGYYFDNGKKYSLATRHYMFPYDSIFEDFLYDNVSEDSSENELKGYYYNDMRMINNIKFKYHLNLDNSKKAGLKIFNKYVLNTVNNEPIDNWLRLYCLIQSGVYYFVKYTKEHNSFVIFYNCKITHSIDFEFPVIYASIMQIIFKKGLKDGEKYNYSDIRDIRFGKQNYYLISCIKIWGYGRGNSGINYLVKKFFE